jgi:hypothetical protein
MSAGRKSGESLRPERVREFGWTREPFQYHETERFRYGGDKRSARPSPTNPADQRAMMRRHEEGIKKRANSLLNPVSRRIRKSSRDREGMKYPLEEDKKQAERGAIGNGFIFDRKTKHGREAKGNG